MSIPEPHEIASLFDLALTLKSNNRPRTVQGKAGIIGPSNMGFCRQQAVLMTKGVQQTDSKNTMAADWGTALHEWIEDAVKTAYPSWLTEADIGKVEYTYACGATIAGTPDIIVPQWNAVGDIKTSDGFQWVKRAGTSTNHKWQRHHYALGAIAKGLLDPSKPVYVFNIYADRSAREKSFYTPGLEEIDPSHTDQINDWLEDVIYAVKNNEDASRDVAAETCEKICEYFFVCRGSLPDEDAELITDPDVIEAAQMYAESMLMEKTVRNQKAEARAMLNGYSGRAGGLQVRWTHVNGSHDRDSSDRISVTKARGV